MNVMQALNPVTWVNRAIDKRIKDYAKGATAEMKYNPLLTTMKVTNDDKQMTRRLLENSVWYSGIEQDISYFYRKEAPKFYRNGEQSESLNYFWTNQDKDMRKIHSGFPQLISEKMTDLIFGNGYNIVVEGEDGTDESEIKDVLDDILKDNKANVLFGKSTETESWAGGFAWKASYNPTISEYPIIEMWQPENYTNRVVTGRIIEDIFFTYYERGNVTYRLSEIYGVDKEKGSYIRYTLHMLVTKQQGQNGKQEWEQCSLSKLDETADLKDIMIEGYFKKLSLYKANKLPNSEFRYSLLGESDYAGSYGAIDAIDEIISTWIQEFRDGKLFRYFPEELMMKNTNGEALYPSQFKKQHYFTADSPSEDVADNKIQYEQGDLRTEKHVETYKIWVTQLLNNAGLSPLTIGITGLESIDASAESQQEREKVSIRTRNKKIRLWTEFLEEFLKMVVEFRYMTEGMRENDDGKYNVGAIPEFDVKVTFEDYIIKSKSDRTIEVQQGIGTSWDVLTGVKYVHDNMTERQQLALSARIKLENNYQSISQAEASALQAENGDNVESLVEQGVDIIPVNENDGSAVPPLNANTQPPEVPIE